MDAVTLIARCRLLRFAMGYVMRDTCIDQAGGSISACLGKRSSAWRKWMYGIWDSLAVRFVWSRRLDILCPWPLFQRPWIVFLVHLSYMSLTKHSHDSETTATPSKFCFTSIAECEYVCGLMNAYMWCLCSPWCLKAISTSISLLDGCVW